MISLGLSLYHAIESICIQLATDNIVARPPYLLLLFFFAFIISKSLLSIIVAHRRD